MSKNSRNKYFPFENASYEILMANIALVIAGLALLLSLRIGLEPKRVTNDISISYNWYNAAPVTLESEVTSILAEVFSTIPGIRSMSSNSSRSPQGKSNTYEKQLRYRKTTLQSEQDQSQD